MLLATVSKQQRIVLALQYTDLYYTFTRFVALQDANDFALPTGFTHEECEYHVGGYHYIHAFHHYLRI
jgi:hypothetical protein